MSSSIFWGFIQRKRSVENSCLDSFKTIYVSLCVGNQQFTNVELKFSKKN
jgi:hypothetical protein